MAGSIRSKTGGGGGGGGGSVVGSVLSSAQALARVSPDVTYVVERCEDEFRDVYKKETSTTLGQATIHRLEPGMSYRFRVYALNSDGIEGPRSDSIIVHTLVEQPATPCGGEESECRVSSSRRPTPRTKCIYVSHLETSISWNELQSSAPRCHCLYHQEFIASVTSPTAIRYV